jgi:hypothetical protein
VIQIFTAGGFTVIKFQSDSIQRIKEIIRFSPPLPFLPCACPVYGVYNFVFSGVFFI